MVEKKRDFCMCTFWNADCCELCSEGYAGLAGEVPAGTPPGGRAALVFECVPIWRGGSVTSAMCFFASLDPSCLSLPLRFDEKSGTGGCGRASAEEHLLPGGEEAAVCCPVTASLLRR